jgi:hypothetical protein
MVFSRSHPGVVVDRGSRAQPYMPPAQIDPFNLPGVIQKRADPISIEDVSSDEELADRMLSRGAKAALHQGAAGAAPSARAARGKAARGGRGGNLPKAADRVLAAPLAVPRGSAPKRGSPLRAAERDHQLREAPEPNKRRRSLSGDVSAAPAAASSAALPSGAAPSDDTLHQMLGKRALRKTPAAAPAASSQDDSVDLASPACQISPDGAPRQSPRFAAPRQAAPAASPFSLGKEGAAASESDDDYKDAEDAEEPEAAGDDDEYAEEGEVEDEDLEDDEDLVKAARRAAEHSGSDVSHASDDGEPNDKVEVNYSMGTAAGDRFLLKVLNVLNLKGGAKLFSGRGKGGNTRLWQQLADELKVDMINLRRRVWLGPTAGAKRNANYQSLMQQRRPFYRTTHAAGESGGTIDRTPVEVMVESLIDASDVAREGRDAELKRETAEAQKRAAKQEAQDKAFHSAAGRGANRHKPAAPEGTPASGSTGEDGSTGGGGSTSRSQGPPKGRPAGGRKFGYGGGTSGRGFTGHPALTRLRMETIVQKAWWELDHVEQIFYKANSTPTTDATNQSEDWPLGYKVENIDGKLTWKHLHRHEESYFVFISMIAENQVDDLETYKDWLIQQEPAIRDAVALLHGALDASPPISTRGGVDAMADMGAGLRRAAELNAEVMKEAIGDRAVARTDGHAEAERVRIATAAESQKVRDAAVVEAQAERLQRSKDNEMMRDVLLAAINSGRAGPAAAASSSMPPPMSVRERMLQLSELLDAQLVTKEEFEAKRRAILDGI